jgi:hypothetical protein
VHARAIAANAVNFFHHAHGVVQMLDDVLCMHFAKGVRWKRPGHVRQVMDDIGADLITDVHVYGTGDFLTPAADVEHTALFRHQWPADSVSASYTGISVSRSRALLNKRRAVSRPSAPSAARRAESVAISRTRSASSLLLPGS